MIPENPLITEVASLSADISMQSGASLDSQASNEVTGIENEEPEDDSQNEPQENNLENNIEEPVEETTEEVTEEPTETPKEETEEVSDTQTPEDSDTGENDTENNEAGENGDNSSGENSSDTPSDAGENTENQPGTGEEPGEDEHGLVTNLSSKIVLFSELENDTLGFYAYYSDRSIDADVKVNFKHKNDAGNGTWLTASNDDYSAKLRLGVNYITVYYTDSKGERCWTRFSITYQADKADEKEPVKGAYPPNIHTNLDDWTGDIETNHFKFTVDARTWQNERIYADCIEVRLNGKLVTNPTGSEIFEYDLYFSKPVSGDYSDYTVTVLAWDKDGNSRFVSYNIRYLAKGKGEAIAPVTVTIDATTVNCGIVESATVEVKGGDSAADAVLKMFETNGFTADFKGSVESSFYLMSISKAYAFRGAGIESRLRELLERDGIAMKPSGTQDKLGEFNYTEGSGWMYFINGSLCPGVGMNEWPLQGGENITLRFTLAYGKDIGASSGGQGNLSSYCAKWIGGSVIESEHAYAESYREEPTGSEDGYIEYTCQKCLHMKEEILPATGEPDQPDPPTDSETPDQPDPPEDSETPDQPDPPGDSETPEQPDPPGDSETPDQPDPPGDSETPDQPDPPTDSEVPEQPDPPTDSETPEETVPEETESEETSGEEETPPETTE